MLCFLTPNTDSAVFKTVEEEGRTLQRLERTTSDSKTADTLKHSELYVHGQLDTDGDLKACVANLRLVCSSMTPDFDESDLWTYQPHRFT